MRVSELQLGDIVSCLGDPVRVVSLSLKGDEPVGIMSPLKTIETFREEDVRPVPLTAEFLIKNGFVKVHSRRYEFYGRDGRIEVNPVIGYIYVYNYDEERIKHCNVYDNYAVHELQHVLRLVGLSEMAENLKV